MRYSPAGQWIHRQNEVFTRRAGDSPTERGITIEDITSFVTGPPVLVTARVRTQHPRFGR
eukprot:8354659-Pyramimonas_sp.AAC.1